MEALTDLKGFVKALNDKGYTGYFHTHGAYPGKLEESICAYLEACRHGTEGRPQPELLLTGYLQWAGEDEPRVQCSMWVQYRDGKFGLNKMKVTKKDRYGQLLKQSELSGLSAVAVPAATEAIAMVSGTPAETTGLPRRRPRF
ncbi:MAG: hypothetical protein ACO1NW_11740 [Chitinophagaceae bacterium]